MRPIILLVIALLGLNIICDAQDATNHLSISTSGSLNFAVNNMSTFETGQTISNAISVIIVSKSYSCHVYMSLSSWSYPATATPSSSPLYLDFASSDASSYTLAGTSFNVVPASQLLFTETKTGAVNTYKYDLRLAALDYGEYKPGNYNFTLTFTMSQP